MEGNKGKCFNCRYFDRYFTRGIKKFNASKVGWCSNKVQVVETQSKCDSYKAKTPYRGVRAGIKYSLNDLFTDLTTLRQILEYDINEFCDEEM